VCDEYQTTVTNSRGDRDINSRVKMLQRFQLRQAEGQQPVLLICQVILPIDAQLDPTPGLPSGPALAPSRVDQKEEPGLKHPDTLNGLAR
jgi:hypothetical protein